MPVAAIERCAGAPTAQMIERLDMRAHQIADMDVVADTCTVRSRVVGAEDLHAVAKAEGSLHRDLYQMRRGTRRLSGAQFGSAPATLK